jgi:hypothetical protein
MAPLQEDPGGQDVTVAREQASLGTGLAPFRLVAHFELQVPHLRSAANSLRVDHLPWQ